MDDEILETEITEEPTPYVPPVPEIGAIYLGEYPPTAAIWCNNNNAYMDDIEPLEGVRRFEIKAVPRPTALDREREFHKEFFNTSLGYIRRSVSMADGSHKDFLSDLLPTIAMAVNMNTPVSIIAYTEPDFSEPVTDWTQYQHIETVTAQFIQECFMQLQNDFLPTNEAS